MVDSKLAVTVALSLLLGSASAVAAADASVGTIKGEKYKMADTVIADKIDVLTDASGEQVLSDGSSMTNPPKWTDISKVYVATGKTPAKLRSKMANDHPPGGSDAFYGADARPLVDERMIYVAVEMAKKLTDNARGQVVEVGLAGKGATPVQVGTDLDTRVGVERFSLNGLFKNGAMASGDTSAIGKEPGVDLEDADYYNAESGVYGFYDARKATWYLVVPRDGATDISVSVRSTTNAGQVIDRLALPDGGHFISLKDPSGGYQKSAGVPALSCRALETFSGEGGVLELSDIDATLIRYTAGVDPSVGQQKRSELLAEAVAAEGPVSVVLTPLGSGDEPTSAQGELMVTPEGNAVQLSFEAPAGQWSFALADELKTPAGELLVDHSSLTGPAGVLTGPGLDGLAAGDLSCITPDEPQAADDAEAADETEDAEAEG